MTTSKTHFSLTKTVGILISSVRVIPVRNFIGLIELRVFARYYDQYEYKKIKIAINNISNKTKSITTVYLLVTSVQFYSIALKRTLFINEYKCGTQLNQEVNQFFLYFALCSGPGSECLDDPPQITLPGFNNSDISDRKLPGELYNGDTQCEFIYGAGWQRCQPLKVNFSAIA